MVSAEQLRAEAGSEGFRAKALKADILQPLIREAGGLQALVSQIQGMRALVDKVGGLRELEQFVSDLRSIRDTLDEFKGSQGLIGLASEVRDLLQGKQRLIELQSEVDGPHGLRARADGYEKITPAFTDVQTITLSQQLASSSIAMNPDRARLMSAGGLDDDPDHDLYGAPPPVVQPRNRTGSNKIPLGQHQPQTAVQPANHGLAAVSPLKKRKKPSKTTFDESSKHPRVDLGRASALVQASLSSAASLSVKQVPGQPRAMAHRSGAGMPSVRSGYTNREAQSTRYEGPMLRSQVQKANGSFKMPELKRSDVQFDKTTGTVAPYLPSYSLWASTHDEGSDAETRLGPVSSPADKILYHPSVKVERLRMNTGSSSVIKEGPGPDGHQLSSLLSFFGYSVAVWIGGPDASTLWDASRSSDLKRRFQIPEDLLMFLLSELAKHIHSGNVGIYRQMKPSGSTCITR